MLKSACPPITGERFFVLVVRCNYSFYILFEHRVYTTKDTKSMKVFKTNPNIIFLCVLRDLRGKKAI